MVGLEEGWEACEREGGSQATLGSNCSGVILGQNSLRGTFLGLWDHWPHTTPC